MTSPKTLQVEPRGELETVITRQFDAPRALVFRTFTEPDLMRRWLYGPDHWEMSRCDVDLRPGGAYRYEWRDTNDGNIMGAGGTFLEVDPPVRLVATERFDEAWYAGEARIEHLFDEVDGRTTLTMTLAYESREARDMALQSGMDTGLDLGYARVDALIRELPTSASGPSHDAKHQERNTVIDEPTVLHVPAEQAAVIHIVTPRDKIQEVMGPAFGELAATLASQDIAPVGPFFSYHYRMTDDTFDFDLGAPVDTPVTAAGRVTPAERPARRVARTIYHGGYDGLGAGWAELMSWVEQNGYRSGEDLWEVYLAGPESSDDPAQWRTELNRVIEG